MSLVELCVHRPVFATMLTVSLVVLGLASYKDLGLDIFPRVDIPTVTITTRLPGAGPEEVDSQVRGWPRRLLAWRPLWRPRVALGQRLEAGLNGRREA